MTVGILGCGWFGFPLALELRQTHVLKGVSKNNYQELAKAGIEPFDFRITSTGFVGNVDNFFEVDVLVFNIPPSKVANYPAALHYIAKIVLDSKQIKRVIHISSTSVYQNNNQLATEATPDTFLKDGNVLFAEHFLRDSISVPVDILRFAGLVGQDRHPVKTLSGRTLAQSGMAPVNLVHLKDCLGITKCLLQRDLNERPITLNVCADNHPTKKAYYTYMAAKYGVPPPVYSGGDKRAYKIVSNAQSKAMLSYKYQKSDVYDF